GWPANVERIFHVSPPEHPRFYCAQRLTLNVTRADMMAAGYSPSVRLFEAAACGVPIITDVREGLERYFDPGREILLAHTSEDIERAISDLPDAELVAIGERARQRVLRSHTAGARAAQLLAYVRERMTVPRAAE